jgi:hypothetical protein
VGARAERRTVTCLFLDVVGSTELVGSLGPERMKRALDEAFADQPVERTRLGDRGRVRASDATRTSTCATAVAKPSP